MKEINEEDLVELHFTKDRYLLSSLHFSKRKNLRFEDDTFRFHNSIAGEGSGKISGAKNFQLRRVRYFLISKNIAPVQQSNK